MTYFTKLKTSVPLSESEIKDSLTAYGDGRIEFFKISSNVEQQMLSIIPVKYQNYFTGSTMKIKGSYIPPHTDSYRKVGINFYIKTDNATTKFFEKRSENIATTQVKGQSEGHVFNEPDLILKDTFVSNDNEVWILDVSKIHSVNNPSGTERIAYSLSSHVLSYEQTVKILKDLI
jgi:hypothetical protein